ncbi:Mov34/MPN/PAD-1 family protein [Tolypothrix tenuis PCC 7101]|uniref:Mov34/MPN/PAD-1 family protein n=1 Tax=Tolypothrix tenuis PCC 7101 TaxID=231146 RepID=A0A1Z4N6Z6_9CYAN|nr:M67 family metallopeptidase [Aulosira sp. FACHB-113]BAZ01484.1 Mov34/MPN/PAD-1 family protein [Tolypothrix tenuis PCC 7101]BAZ74593.1 Mov34/MPN/PAD-1 family protein [Aulosira laxa NIES-50]
MILQLLPEHLQIIRTHAESTYPDECCGIILGHVTLEGKTVVEIMPTENAWNTEAANFSGDRTTETERRRYAIAPQVMLQAQRKARDRSLNIIGIYHSHPDAAAIPSECDRLYAWPEYSYIIVSVQKGKAETLQSWSLDESHQFQPEAINNII